VDISYIELHFVMRVNRVDQIGWAIVGSISLSSEEAPTPLNLYIIHFFLLPTVSDADLRSKITLKIVAWLMRSTRNFALPLDRNFAIPGPFGDGKHLPTCKYWAMQPQLCGGGLRAL